MNSQDKDSGIFWIYAIGDGDNVRQRMEKQLLYENLEGCKNVSESISEGMNCVNLFFSSKEGWNVEFCGGDDILIKVNSRKYNSEFLRQAIKEFERCSGSTISFGSGYSLHGAYLNLRRAKAIGTGRLICETELTNKASAPSKAWRFLPGGSPGRVRDQDDFS